VSTLQPGELEAMQALERDLQSRVEQWSARGFSAHGFAMVLVRCLARMVGWKDVNEPEHSEAWIWRLLNNMEHVRQREVEHELAQRARKEVERG
jgi:hypothetical protein